MARTRGVAADLAAGRDAGTLSLAMAEGDGLSGCRPHDGGHRGGVAGAARGRPVRELARDETPRGVARYRAMRWWAEPPRIPGRAAATRVDSQGSPRRRGLVHSAVVCPSGRERNARCGSCRSDGGTNPEHECAETETLGGSSGKPVARRATGHGLARGTAVRREVSRNLRRDWDGRSRKLCSSTPTGARQIDTGLGRWTRSRRSSARTWEDSSSPARMSRRTKADDNVRRLC